MTVGKFLRLCLSYSNCKAGIIIVPIERLVMRTELTIITSNVFRIVLSAQSDTVEV